MKEIFRKRPVSKTRSRGGEGSKGGRRDFTERQVHAGYVMLFMQGEHVGHAESMRPKKMLKDTDIPSQAIPTSDSCARYKEIMTDYRISFFII